MPENNSRAGDHWVVRMNHRNRTASWWIVFAIFALHFRATGQETLAWVLMSLQFLVYPHVVYAVARISRDPMGAELNNLRLDDFCFGLWAGWLGFPLWIAYLLVICGCINLAAFRGFRGALEAAALSALGAIVSVACFGLRFVPDTTMPVTALSMACLTIYLLLFARGAYTRAITLNETRYKLRQSEQALQGQLDAVQALQAQLLEQANRDALTGLYNRRYLSDALSREFERSARTGNPLSMLLVDIDHFKQINDQFGHSTGDRVIQSVASLLARNMGSRDVAFRYGGEEFLILLPELDASAALARAERYRAETPVSAEVSAAHGRPVTLSIGIASTAAMADKVGSPQQLIDQADAALYQAKLGGRNRCSVYQGADEVAR
jgi:diguanylate cyclase (GGDEF)-like protein